MRFAAFWALPAAVAAWMIALYLLKARPQRLVVSSMLLWRRLGSVRSRRSEHWRRLASLLFALTIGLGIALALTCPDGALPGAGARRLALVLDHSPSMEARTADGMSRWQHALRAAAATIAGAAGGIQVLVIDATTGEGSGAFVDRAAALRALNDLAPGAAGVPRPPALPAGADRDTDIHLVTDGISSLHAELTRQFQAVQVDSVFEPADNAAVTAFAARPLPGQPTQWEALVRVFNASIATRRVRLTIDGHGFHVRREVTIPPRAWTDLLVDVSAFRGGTLRAVAHLDGDALPLDDAAYAAVQAHAALRVLLVTSGGVYLEQALRFLPGVQLTVSSPRAYRDSDAFDAYVFDRFAPRREPPAGAVLFRPPAADWTPAVPPSAGRLLVTRWQANHPLTAAISWHDLHVTQGRLEPIPHRDASDAALVLGKSVREGALISIHEGRPRQIRIGFAVEDSNLHLQAGFPVFLAAALDWVAPRPPALERSTGVVDVALRDAVVRDHGGQRIDVFPSADGTAFMAAQPNVYALAAPTGDRQVVVAPVAFRFSDINNGSLASGTIGQVSRKFDTAPQWQLPPPMLLLALATLLLMLEWLAYARGLTV